MARFYFVQIEDIYLTDTGLVGGDPCKLQIPGAAEFLFPFSGQTEISADGTPYNTIFEGTKGKQLQIIVETLPETVWNDLRTLINEKITNSENLTISATGDIGNFTLSVLPQLPSPQLPSPFSAESFRNGRVKNVRFSFITT